MRNTIPSSLSCILRIVVGYFSWCKDVCVCVCLLSVCTVAFPCTSCVWFACSENGAVWCQLLWILCTKIPAWDSFISHWNRTFVAVICPFKVAWFLSYEGLFVWKYGKDRLPLTMLSHQGKWSVRAYAEYTQKHTHVRACR